MMKSLLLLVLVVVALSDHIDVTEEDEREWEMFKLEYEKEYTEIEEQIRKEIFLDNLRFVSDHNKKYKRKQVSHEMAINVFADLTAKEFSATKKGFKGSDSLAGSEGVFDIPDDEPLPNTVDWRKMGAVTLVKDQMHCNSCWAFSATGALEGQNFIVNKKLVSLSEQNLVDCASTEGCHGGGFQNDAFLYVKGNGGIDTEASYPYEGRGGPCRYRKDTKGTMDIGYKSIPVKDEKKLQAAVALIGPISVAIDASQIHKYSRGVYKNPYCSETNLDHSVLVVGYGTTNNGEDYWLVKNSWGTDWGMKGYFLLARNQNNMCGVATSASYPIIKNSSNSQRKLTYPASSFHLSS